MQHCLLPADVHSTHLDILMHVASCCRAILQSWRFMGHGNSWSFAVQDTTTTTTTTTTTEIVLDSIGVYLMNGAVA